MATGLFEALSRYSPRKGIDPLENFITEGFAWILNNYSEFGTFFLQYLEKELQWNVGNYDCEWRTQENFDGKRPDMVCRFNGENRAIIFEHKTWSSLSKNQLANYREYAEQKFDDCRIVLITATRPQHEQDPDLALCWSEIYNLISAWGERELLVEDFQQLLKSRGLGPPAPISHTSIRYHFETKDLEKNINNLIERVQGRAEQEREWAGMIEEDFDILKRGSWGRIGLELLSSWEGGIFVGIMVDGKDHKTKPIDPVKGPDFCLIISFDRKLHDFYPQEESYKKLVEELQKKVERLNDGWQFYDHLNDSDVRSKNRWHPIHIRKPMLDVFCGTESGEEQEDRFYGAASELIQLVVKEESFWSLRRACKEHLRQRDEGE